MHIHTCAHVLSLILLHGCIQNHIRSYILTVTTFVYYLLYYCLYLLEGNREMLLRSGFMDQFGKEWLFPSIEDAVSFAAEGNIVVSCTCSKHLSLQLILMYKAMYCMYNRNVLCE